MALTWPSVQLTLFQRDKLASGANRQSMLLFATHDAGRRPPSSRVNFVIASPVTMMFCQRRAVGRQAQTGADGDSARLCARSPADYIDGSRPASCFRIIVFH